MNVLSVLTEEKAQKTFPLIRDILFNANPRLPLVMRIVEAKDVAGDSVKLPTDFQENGFQNPKKPYNWPFSSAATMKDSPFLNSLGQAFVPIPRFDTLFCVYPVRVQDYAVYCAESGVTLPACPFPNDRSHPVAGISWNDANKFCQWLTAKEHSLGLIDDFSVYRLPTDLEWSAAVGLQHEPEATPSERHLKALGYPWGFQWPPPDNCGNYEPRRQDQVGYLATSEFIPTWVFGNLRDEPLRTRNFLKIAQEFKNIHSNWRADWQFEVDTHEYTSPVGSFDPNIYDIYDLGGNVWEWCSDNWASGSGLKVLRGASYASHHFEENLDPTRSIMLHGFTYQDITDEGLVLNTSDILLPIRNELLYRSSCRFATTADSVVETSLGCGSQDIWLSVLENNGTKLPITGFRVVLEAPQVDELPLENRPSFKIKAALKPSKWQYPEGSRD